MHSRNGLKINLALLGIVFVSFTSVLQAATATFHGLGDFPGGLCWSMALDVSADGSVVVGFGNSDIGREPSRWTQWEGMIGLGDLPGGDDFYGAAYGVSADGSVVVGYSESESGQEAFRWTESTGSMVGLGDLPGGDFVSCAYDVSADGSVVVGRSKSESGKEAFRWTESEGMVGLGDLPGGDFRSLAYDVSADGSVVVGYSYSESGTEAFRWTESTGMVGLGDLPGGDFYSEARAVSADGSVVFGVGTSELGKEAFRWTESEGMIGLGAPPYGDYFNPLATSADGSIAVGTTATDSAWEAALIWDAGGILNLQELLENSYGLDLTGWTLTTARDITPDGLTIVGYGYDPNGCIFEAWIAVLGEANYYVTLTVNVEPNDIGINTVTPDVGQHSYPANWPVVANAEAFINCPDVWRFDHWEGEVADPNSARTLVTMIEDNMITAVFAADERICGDECHPILEGDLNGDCYINFEDFALYTDNWLSCTHPDCD